MGYIHCDGKKYGIVPKRNIIDSILVNLPLINLLYTKKIKVNITSRLKSGAPVKGIFSYVRIYNTQNTLMVRFMVPDNFTNVLLTIDGRKCYDSVRELDKEKIYYPGLEYSICLIVREYIW